MIGLIKRLAEERRAAADVVQMFSGNLAESDVNRIIEMRIKSAGYDDSFVEMLQADDCIEALSDDALLLSFVETEVKADHRQSNKFGVWPKLSIAAGLVLAVMVGFFTHGQLGKKDTNILRYVTKVGQQKSIELTDGSVVTLNTGSQILVDMQDDKRIVTLDRGEAYFEVASDPARPFSVDLDGRMVTVLGTEFNITKATEGFVLAVTEGMVSLHGENEVASNSASKIVAAGEEKITLTGSRQRRFGVGMVAEFDIHKQSLTAYKADNINHFSGWRSGILRFESELLSNVLLELNRYSVKKILVRDTSLLNLKVSASIKADDIGGGLSALEYTLPIKVIHQFGKILIVSP